ncbi:hypothetical protein GGI25_003333 [Coemansia spiralis]|uniref:Ribosomal protein n=2 Tax=Coemansia TaxID=4863 RepID=A0A9W8G8V2_9FUNG|nr:ribosomal protein L1-like protein [Coemansia spiralis]KAJ1992779.1 hypothetical protein EDC05_002563 [Coemansia umbellata]KAJ2622563.1 hypothetical protein GGI26_003162 [Coemansia sp. RSA 1358]KAJ2677113.1 hypothetical protein GGI25_003333 [Coemansia spiralis]
MSLVSRFALKTKSVGRAARPIIAQCLIRSYASKRQAKPHPNSVPLEQAISILKAYEVGQPKQTVELHVHCSPEKGQPPIRGTCVLPHAYKLDIKVLVFAEGEKAKEAKAAGADFVGGDELIEMVRNDEVVFEKCLSTPEMLPKVAKIARLLGPKGLMPTVNKGTVTSAVAESVQFSKNSHDFRADKANIVHTGVAKVGFTPEDIAANIKIVMNSIREHGRFGKGKFISRVFLSSTHGPGVQVADA